MVQEIDYSILGVILVTTITENLTFMIIYRTNIDIIMTSTPNGMFSWSRKQKDIDKRTVIHFIEGYFNVCAL